VDKTKVYSPNQVFAASIAGGPGAMVYVLWKNFKALENPDGQKQILVWGAAFLALLLIALPFLPIGFPNYVLPIAYAVAARFLAQQYQMSKQAIQQSERYEFQSNWNVVGVSVLFLIAAIVVLLAWVLLLSALGVGIDS